MMGVLSLIRFENTLFISVSLGSIGDLLGITSTSSKVNPSFALESFSVYMLELENMNI